MRLRFLQAAVFVFALSVGVRADLGGCQEFSGDFTSTLIPPPTCQSPVGLCTHGVLTGDIEGTYDFVMTELVCGTDPDNPDLCTYAGDSVVTTAKCDANVMAQPQFATCDSECRAARMTPVNVLLLCDAGSGFNASLAKARLASPMHAISMKQARQPKPVTAAASGVVAITPPT